MKMRKFALNSGFACNSNTNDNGDEGKTPVIVIINVIAVIVSLSLAGLSIHRPKLSFFNEPKISYAQMPIMTAFPNVNYNAPKVAIIAPVQDTNFMAPANITISATASASADIIQVVFYKGGDVIGVTSLTPYTMTWINAPVGDYVLTAKVIDVKGGTAFSEPVSITVLDRSATGCSCDAGCDERTFISPPFTYDGFGEFCWQATSLGRYVYSWNLDALNINGVDRANLWTNTFPPSRAGIYYIYYKSTSDTGHFEMK
jgi:hypothetical protein